MRRQETQKQPFHFSTVSALWLLLLVVMKAMSTPESCRRDGYSLEEGLAAVGFGRFQLFVLAYAGFGWFSEAMELMILSFVGPAVQYQWALSSTQQTLLTSVVFAGMLLGAYSWGIVSDIFGRRTGFLWITMLTCGVGLLSTFSPNYISLLILRSMVGFGLGGGHVFTSWFLEFIPASHRGTWMVVFSTFWTFGTIFEASLAWIVMPRLSWRWLLGFSSIPSFALLLLYSVVPESPRYLCMKGRVADAQNILEKMASLNHRELPTGMLVSVCTTELDEESVPSKQTPLLLPSPKKVDYESKQLFSSFFLLFSPKLLCTTLLLWVLFFGNAFAYYGIVLLTSELSSEQNKCDSTIMLSRNLGSDSLYLDVFITSLAELPGLLLSALIVDKVGRRFSMVILFGLATISLLPMVFGVSEILRTASLFGARMCATGAFTIACIYAPELYPTSMRATGAGVAAAVGKIGGMICPLVAVGLVTGCYIKEAIILFLVVISFTAICTLFFPLETKGRELSDTLADSGTKQLLVVS